MARRGHPDDHESMKRRLDSALVQRALALSEAVNRHLGDVDRRLEERATAREVAPAAAPASIPGMPLPTGYGLQVRGPQGESIVLPVCLPPGFELDSMMLCPEFLPRVEDAQPRRRAGQAAAPPAKAPTANRLDGVMQLVFGADQSFATSIEHTPDAPAPAPAVQPLAAGVAVPEPT
jgi:hypothetical protein